MKASPVCLAWNHQRFSGLRSAISEDVLRYLTKSPHDLARGDNLKTRISACLTPEVFPIVLYRIAHYLYAAGWRRAAAAVSRANFVLNKVYLTPQSCIGPGLRLPHPAGLTFHGRAGRGFTMFSLAICCPGPEQWDGPTEAGPSFGDHVTVAAHAVVHGPITVGSGTTVAHGIPLHSDAPGGVLVTSRKLRVSIRPQARVR